MKVAIIGTGAMGSLFAALLSTVADIVMVGSWTEQLQAVRSPGLTLRRLDGSESLHTITSASLTSLNSRLDLALVLVKGWQTEDAVTLTRIALAENGLAVTLQNGLGNFDILAQGLGSDRVVQGVTSEGATMIHAGLVRYAGAGHTHFAASNATRSRLEQLVSLFTRAGLSASLVADAEALIWGKLAVNAAINPLTALLQVANGHLPQNPVTLDIMRRAAYEVAAVAERLGIDLPFDDAADQAIAVAHATAGNRSSMAQDIARGMPTEIEQICGAVAQRGRLLGLPTPMNEALLSLVRSLVRSGSWHDAVNDLSPESRTIFGHLLNMENS